ncbi:MAG TPA: hypothetical protein VM735_04285, partial [Candidatus Kapabacteria bacterium]|nr:hypothetical protein [Candidatus Kapabacteria bacterium]
VAWLARVFRVHEVVSSNLTAPTSFTGLSPIALDFHFFLLPTRPGLTQVDWLLWFADRNEAIFSPCKNSHIQFLKKR